MTRRRPQQVSMVCSATVEDFDGNTTEQYVTLRYSVADPYAVILGITVPTTHGPKLVVWTFSRDLLSAGLIEASGDGDVHIEAHDDDEYGEWTAPHMDITLESPSGWARLHLARVDLQAFVSKTHYAVPLGSESERIDWDKELEGMMTE